MEPYQIEQIIRPELQAGEILHWSGQPDRHRLFSPTDLFLVPFSLFWCGFALFWEFSALSISFNSQTPWGIRLIFPLFGLPFVLIGLYLVFGRFIHRALRKAHTFYAITNQRVLVLSTLKRRRIQSHALPSIPAINKSVRADGSGSILFGDAPFNATILNAIDSVGERPEGSMIIFFDLPEVETVYRLVETLRKSLV